MVPHVLLGCLTCPGLGLSQVPAIALDFLGRVNGCVIQARLALWPQWMAQTVRKEMTIFRYWWEEFAQPCCNFQHPGPAGNPASQRNGQPCPQGLFMRFLSHTPWTTPHSPEIHLHKQSACQETKGSPKRKRQHVFQGMCNVEPARSQGGLVFWSDDTYGKSYAILIPIGERAFFPTTLQLSIRLSHHWSRGVAGVSEPLTWTPSSLIHKYSFYISC